MPAITPIRDEDVEFDHGTFDSAAFTNQALSSWQSLAQVIDHTLLKPEATREQVESLCDEAVPYRFACAMVNPVWVPTAVEMMSGTGIPVGVVIGFPTGNARRCRRRRSICSLRSRGLAMCESCRISWNTLRCWRTPER